MNISFDGINQEIVTFLAKSDVVKGQPVKVSDNMTAAACADGNVFAGIAAGTADDGAAAVVIHGYVQVHYTGTAPALGYVTVAANGSGGVKAASAGRSVIVCDVDSKNATVGMFI